MTRIILIRHGQTEWNKQERFRGRADIELDETGRRQAQAVAAKVAQWKVDAVYSSPMKRATATAEAIASRLGLAVQILDGINDMSFGVWEGLPIDEAREKDPALFDLWLHHPERLVIPGAETLEDVRKRAVAAVDEVVVKHKDQIIALVTHRVVCKVLLCHVLGLDNSHFWCIAQDTTAINLFEVVEGKSAVTLINDTCHLGSLEA